MVFLHARPTSPSVTRMHDLAPLPRRRRSPSLAIERHRSPNHANLCAVTPRGARSRGAMPRAAVLAARWCFDRRLWWCAIVTRGRYPLGCDAPSLKCRAHDALPRWSFGHPPKPLRPVPEDGRAALRRNGFGADIRPGYVPNEFVNALVEITAHVPVSLFGGFGGVHGSSHFGSMPNRMPRSVNSPGALFSTRTLTAQPASSSTIE